MSDDPDGCEWVSVSSGTGLPRVVLDQRPLNGCVCVRVRVCVCVCVCLFDAELSCSSLAEPQTPLCAPLHCSLADYISWC